ncbi:MAG: DUF1214 domain-containing protein [Pseudomonadota bacterium]
MIRNLPFVIVILCVGLAIGWLSARYTLQRTQGVGSINVGIWSAWLFVGGERVDPYTDARSTIEGTIPLGAGEGLAFETSRDQAGAPLRRECQYKLVGVTPASRFWTLVAYDLTGHLLFSEQKQESAIFSGDIVRNPDNSFQISVGKFPSAGNWISTTGSGNYKFVLRLYDTTMASGAGLLAPELPSIEKVKCA